MNEVLTLGSRPGWFEVNLLLGSDNSFALQLQNSETGEPMEPGTTDAVLHLGGLAFLAAKNENRFTWAVLAADVPKVVDGATAELVFVNGNRRQVFARGKVYVR